MVKIFSFAIACLVLSPSTVYAQKLSADQKLFLEKSAVPISVNAADQPDWSAVLAQAKNKRLILIGEFTHGAAEIFELRNSLVVHLHEKLGVNTLLFESGIGELMISNSDKDSLNGREMTYGLFGGWRNIQFVNLMQYVKVQQMSIAGFDVQRTGNSFPIVLQRIAKQFNVDSAAFNGLEVRYGSLTRMLQARGARYDSLKGKVNELVADYSNAKDRLNAISTKRKGTNLTMAPVVIENRIAYLTYMLQFLKDNDWHRRWAARDSLMANNVTWLMENIYTKGPVVIIGHNFHISKDNENERTMGEYLKKKYEKDMLAIGVFAGDGSYNDNSGKPVKMLPPDSQSLDIKHIIAALPAHVSYITMPRKFSPGNDWLNKELVINDTFIDISNSNKVNLFKAFDGLLLLKTVSPPEK